ncbi:MAG: PTS sugar transporter subunit IIA [Pseudomonadota bacterium]
MSQLIDILSPTRTLCRAKDASKKRLFETIADVVSRDQATLSSSEVLTQLTAREKLGSTALGQGIAIPHCRVGSCTRPLGSLLTLAEPIPFDAPDDQPVDLLFVLLVPEEAQQQHLDILAEVARLFSQDGYCKKLRSATDSDTLYHRAVEGTG